MMSWIANAAKKYLLAIVRIVNLRCTVDKDLKIARSFSEGDQVAHVNQILSPMYDNVS
jgi:hypothetical protein